MSKFNTKIFYLLRSKSLGFGYPKQTSERNIERNPELLRAWMPPHEIRLAEFAKANSGFPGNKCDSLFRNLPSPKLKEAAEKLKGCGVLT
jgi:hypothetical protein